MTSTPRSAIVRLPHAAGLDLPAYETDGAAGLDLRAAVPEDRPLILPPGRRAAVPTGLNTPGTIDSDYRGEVKVLLVNLGDEEFAVTRGMRIAQLVVAPVTRVTVEEHQTSSATARGAGGFGSTGTA